MIGSSIGCKCFIHNTKKKSNNNNYYYYNTKLKGRAPNPMISVNFIFK